MSDTQTTPVRAGFIGVGNFVQGTHLPNAAASPLWNVEAICDLNDSTLAAVAEKYRPRKVTRDHREVLDDPAVEAVFIGTRHDLHEPLIAEATAAGKDVFVEKPMSKTWEETRRIVDAVRRSGARLMVGYNRRFSPCLTRAKEVFLQRHRGKVAMLTYRIVDDARLWPAWPMDPKIGGGKVLSEACHIYDLACWFLEDEPVWVQACGGRGDNNFIEVGFANGSMALIVSGGLGSAAYSKERMEVFCDSTTLVTDMFLDLHVAGYDAIEDELFPMEFDPYPELGPADAAGYRRRVAHWRAHGIRQEDFARRAYHGSHPKVDKGHRNEINAFAHAIRAGLRSPCDEIDGARATAVALKAIASLEDANRPQSLLRSEYA